MATQIKIPMIFQLNILSSSLLLIIVEIFQNLNTFSLGAKIVISTLDLLGKNMVAIAFYSITGQTKRFMEKTQLKAYQISDANPKYDMGQKYILIVPAYQDFMMDSVVDFLTFKDNKKNIIGIIGCGNRNFNDLFAQTAKKIAATLNIPILYLLEFSGTDEDVKNVRKIVHDLSKGESTKEVQKPKELRVTLAS